MIKFVVYQTLVRVKEKTVKYLNASRCKLVFFILDLLERGFLKGMYLKLKSFVRSKNSHDQEFIISNLSFKGKSKSHI